MKEEAESQKLSLTPSQPGYRGEGNWGALFDADWLELLGLGVVVVPAA